jgi:hypothetical protein
MKITTEIGRSPAERSGKVGGRRISLRRKEFYAPFPVSGVYGTDPRRRGYVVEEIIGKRENFFHHRCAPSTAAVPFPKKLDFRERGQCKGPEAG